MNKIRRYLWGVESSLKEEFEFAISFVKKGSYSGQGVLFCSIVKDEIYYIKNLIEYYRGMGIVDFVLIDNLSSDGTFEYLSEQGDVTLYRFDQGVGPYFTVAKNYLCKTHGIGRWCLYADADEFLDFHGDLSKYLSGVREKGFNCVFTPMVDLYGLDDIKHFDDEFKQADYSYFCADRSAYLCRKLIPFSKSLSLKKSLFRVYGGIRQKEFDMWPMINKYAINFVSSDSDVYINEHYPLPLSRVVSPIAIPLKHYKFTGSFHQKVEAAIKGGQYWGESREYNVYKRNLDSSWYGFKKVYSEHYSKELFLGLLGMKS